VVRRSLKVRGQKYRSKKGYLNFGLLVVRKINLDNKRIPIDRCLGTTTGRTFLRIWVDKTKKKKKGVGGWGRRKNITDSRFEIDSTGADFPSVSRELRVSENLLRFPAKAFDFQKRKEI